MNNNRTTDVGVAAAVVRLRQAGPKGRIYKRRNTMRAPCYPGGVLTH